MKRNMLTTIKNTFFPQVSGELVSEFDKINLDSIHTISLIGVIIETLGLISLLPFGSTFPHFFASLISVVYGLSVCVAALVISGVAKKRNTMSHSGKTVFIFSILILLIIWGMMVSYMYYVAGEQIITFFTVMIVVTCFLAVKPYAGTLIVMLSFIAYYIVLGLYDGAARIEGFNYITFGVICAAGSVTRYHLTLKHLVEKAEIDRLNASLQQDVQKMQYEVTKRSWSFPAPKSG